jgi:hypothetical protein
MKIGSKIIVKKEGALVRDFVEKTGTIVREYMPNSQASMSLDEPFWVVKFDTPVNVCGEQIATCEFHEDELMLYSEFLESGEAIV